MRLPGLGMEPFADDLSVLNDQTADQGVGAGAPNCLPRQLHAPPHVEGVVPPLASDADRTAAIAARNGRPRSSFGRMAEPIGSEVERGDALGVRSFGGDERGEDGGERHPFFQKAGGRDFFEGFWRQRWI